MPSSQAEEDGSDLTGAAEHMRRAADARARASHEVFGAPPLLTEEARALALGIFDRLVGRIEGDLVAALTPGTVQHSTQAGYVADSVKPALAGSPVSAAIFRRADEHTVAARLRSAAASTGHGTDTVAELLARDADAELAGLSMAYVVAAARRVGPLGEPLLPFDELSAADAETLVWLSTAALANAIPDADVDALQNVARAVLSDHARDRGIAARARRLANRLRALGADDDAMLASAFEAGLLPLTAAVFAARGSLRYEDCIDALSGREPSAWALLARAAGLGPGTAQRMFDLLGVSGSEPAAAGSRAFVSVSDTDATEALRAWRRDPGLSAALLKLGK